ncbi:MAG: FHA domain-containing protein [Acidimicrobiales bacterium]|nr:FHA domain-containing protein [Acidimicrobiales bacterium]
MPDQLLNLLKIFLLLLLYLFFLRVMRAVWAEVNPPKALEAPARAKHGRQPRRGGARRGGGAPVLRVLAPPEVKGRSFPLAEEITLGRAAGCQVTIDDTYASQLHARVFQRDGTVYVEDLGSTNGTYLNRKKVTGPMVLQRGDKLQIGNTVLELGQ